MTLPVAKNSNGTKITQNFQDEIIFDSSDLTVNKLGLYYFRAPNTVATLTIQLSAESKPITIDSSLWTYTSGPGLLEGGNTTTNGYGFVTINRSGIMADSKYALGLDNGFDYGSIYHFNYVAIDPRPFGLGFLGIRDLISFLRYDQTSMNPLKGLIKMSIGTGISQSGRFIKDFLYLGYNNDNMNRWVFEGILPLVSGARRTFTNYRFAKPGDYSRQHETHYTPGDQFPFTYTVYKDPITNKYDGILKKAIARGKVPKIYHWDALTVDIKLYKNI